MSMVQLPGLQTMIDSISAERNLPKSAVQEALREALLKGYERYRRTYRPDSETFDEHYFDNFEVELDTEEEGFRILSTKTIVEIANVPDHQIALSEVREVATEAQLGDTVILDVTPEQSDFGRMAAIQTKQVLSQKLRDQQRRMIQEEFQDLEGTVLQARVLRFERQSVIMAVSSGLGQPEQDAELLKRDQLPNDNYRVNATFRVYLKKVSEGLHRGPQLLVSRADAGLVVYLFANEVPEIEDEIVRIVAVAREANPSSRSVGPRTKIAVDTLERDVDPVGACIGARGSRIQVVVNELRGEKIDVIRWSPDPATYIANALSPARVDEVRLINPEDRQAHVLVPNDQLSLAIGKEGQNVRLAARLTGWKIDIKDVAKYDQEAEDRKIAELLAARRLEEAEQEQLKIEPSDLEQLDDVEQMIHAPLDAELPADKVNPDLDLPDPQSTIEDEESNILDAPTADLDSLESEKTLPNASDAMISVETGSLEQTNGQDSDTSFISGASENKISENEEHSDTITIDDELATTTNFDQPSSGFHSDNHLEKSSPNSGDEGAAQPDRQYKPSNAVEQSIQEQKAHPHQEYTDDSMIEEPDIEESDENPE